MNNKLQANTGAKRLFSVSMVTALKSVLIFAIGVTILRFILLGFALSTESKELMWLRSLPALLSTSVFHYKGNIAWSELFVMLFHSSIIVLVAICWSTYLSIVLGYQLAKKAHSSCWDFLSSLFTFASGLPLFAVGLSLAYFISVISVSVLSNAWFIALQLNLPVSSLLSVTPSWQLNPDSTWYMVLRLIAAGFMLGSFDCALGEAPRNFRAIFNELQNKTYYQVFQANGRGTAGIAYRAIRPYFLRSLATRVSYMFGGVIIIEKALDLPQLGAYFIDRCFPGAYSGNDAYVQALCAGILLIAAPVLIRMLIEIRLKITLKSLT
jgi:ABC-type dipeptide/oligopeptide/nickel transport system permease component